VILSGIMDQKKVGIVLLVLSVLATIVMIDIIQTTKSVGAREGCFQSEECLGAATALGLSHVGVGLLFALFSLGVYMVVFSKSDAFWLKKLEQQKQGLTNEEKWKIVQLMLDEQEWKVVEAVRDQPGITQFTLRLRTDLSKAKLSDILSRFEKRGFIERHPQGKSLAIYLKTSF